MPLAAFVSLTLTYRLEKATRRFLVLIAPALEALASSCAWPCMPIVASLWIQKAKRWNDYFLFSASSTVFHHNRDAVVQLLKCCFTSTLGLDSASVYNNSGVSALLGNGLGGTSPVSPGILYFKVYRYIEDNSFLTEEILSTLMLSVRDIASSECELPKRGVKKVNKTKHGRKHGLVSSLARSMARVKHAALLGASLVWISGGQKLVQSLIMETLPSWFLTAQEGGEPGVVVGMLRGHVLAFFVMLSGAFAWGIDQCSPPPKRRAKVLGLHLEFLASTLEKNTSLRCHFTTWRTYVSGFVSLMVNCAPVWVREVDVILLKRLSRELRRLNEPELALRLLELGGIGVMGAAAEMIIELEQ